MKKKQINYSIPPYFYFTYAYIGNIEVQFITTLVLIRDVVYQLTVNYTITTMYTSATVLTEE